MRKSRRFKQIAGIILLWAVLGGGVLRAIQADVEGVLTPERLKPRGETYETTVPATLDLAEQVKLSVQGLTEFLNPNQNYAPYGQVWLNVRAPYFTSRMPFSGPVGSGQPNWGKITEALIMTRLMSGSEQNLDIDPKTIKGMIDFAPEDGWTPTARITLALMALYQRNPDPKLKAVIQRLINSHYARVKQFGSDMAFLIDLPFDAQENCAGYNGYGPNVFINGTAIRALTRWHDLVGDTKSLELAGKLTRFITLPKYWAPESEPKAVFGADHAHFNGHHHSYTACFMGLVTYANATGDARLKEFVREGYEYYRNWGIARIGLFGEMCSVGDMTFVAIKLSDGGVGDYWEDVDCYARNMLVDRQVRDPKLLQKAVQTEPIYARLVPRESATDTTTLVMRTDKPMFGIGQNLEADGLPPAPLEPRLESDERVVERCVGTYLSDAGVPDEVPKHRLLWNICCTGNATSALYYVWEAIIRYDNASQTAQVNLLLNRASAWLDIDSYLPYEGKAVIHNKTAKNLTLRIPRWVDRQALRIEKNGRPASFFWTGNYCVLGGLKAKDEITARFPMVETKEKYSLKWNRAEIWQEGTNPSNLRPMAKPEEFTFHMKGNTLVDITPRRPTAAYSSFLRDEYKATAAPLMKVRRFVADHQIQW